VITAGEMPSDDADQFATTADRNTPTPSHSSRLKWLPYRAHDAANAETKSDDATTNEARAVVDPSVVQAQATSSVANPFNDDPTQLAQQSPSGPSPNIGTNVPEANPTPEERFNRGRAPARLSPGQPLDVTPTVPEQPAPYFTPGTTVPQEASCADHNEKCRQDEAHLVQNTIDKVGLDINEYGKQGDAIPCECTIGNGVVFEPRHWCLMTYTWKASALCHKPLYFEEVQIERYGHSPGPIIEPLLSAAHFFVTVPLLPYYMGVDPPMECQYTLGYYRPGDCAPYMLDPFPLSVRGLALELGVATGVAEVIP
jgi:hypothetical protein